MGIKLDIMAQMAGGNGWRFILYCISMCCWYTAVAAIALGRSIGSIGSFMIQFYDSSIAATFVQPL